jgi:CubicO group peptidase (beta-lactamase class C family)
MKKVSYLFLFLSVVLIICSCSKSKVLREASPESVNVSSERLARIDKMLQQTIDSGWTAGAVGFIARDGKIVYNKAFGVSDIETNKKMLPDDIFRIASQTKAITSIAAMMLFEEGKFLLDDPVSKYIPEFKSPQVLETYNETDTTYTAVPAKREITVRNLLTHTSGIDYAGIGSPRMRAIYAKADIPGGFGTDKMILSDKMKTLGKMPLVHQPGEKFTYSLSVDVLG